MKESLRERPFEGWSNALARPLAVVRSYYPLLNLVVVGLIAVAVSGAICGLIAWRFGRGAIAGDTLSSRITLSRCNRLLEDHDGVIGDCFWDCPTYVDADQCGPGYLIESSEHVVSVQLMAIPAAGIVSMAYLFLDGVRRRRGEPMTSLRLEPYLGLTAFGLAALVLLGIAAVRGAQGNADGLGRWLSDGSVAAGFGAVYAWLVLPSRRSDQPSAA
jgi:hypothetical protein